MRTETSTHDVAMNTRSYWCLAILGVAVMSGFVGLGAWLWYIQVEKHGYYLEAAKSRASEVGRRQPARRGGILDVHGSDLAKSEPVRTVCVNPSFIHVGREAGTRRLAPHIARRLAPHLDRRYEDLLERLTRMRRATDGQVKPYEEMVLERGVPLARWRRITEAMESLTPADLGIPKPKKGSRAALDFYTLRTRSVYGKPGYLRDYPNGRLAAHILGHTVESELDTGGGPFLEVHGASGLEQSFDSALAGVPGWRSSVEDLPPRAGLNVVLTLDAGLQAIAEQELRKGVAEQRSERACAIVVRPRTGEVLALASLPDFDPRDPGQEGDSWFNSAIMGTYAPGSTFKIVAMGAALEHGAVTLDKVIHCSNGRWKYPQAKVLRDHHSYGLLSCREVIAKSSNIGTARVALEHLGFKRFHESISRFGYGRLTRLPLPNERAGTVRSLEFYSRKPTDRTRLPIGQGLAVTPLQTVMAMSAVANDGVLMRPRLIDRVEDARGGVVRWYAPEALGRALSARATAELIKALRDVVSPEGTARALQLDHYCVAGKTGTAEILDRDGNLKGDGSFLSFVGFLPASDPQLCIIVGFEKYHRQGGHFGSTVAGPVFKEIARRSAAYLGIQPDIAPETFGRPGLGPSRGPRPQLVNQRFVAFRRPLVRPVVARR